MLLAELEIHHSRPIAPTRRVALGRSVLSFDPAPGTGAVLLGAICARFGPETEPDSLADVVALTHQLERGERVAQPRVRHRFQRDRVGLASSVQRLHGDGTVVWARFEHSKAAPIQLVLAAVYAAGAAPVSARRAVMASIRLGLGWRGDIGQSLYSALAGAATGIDVAAADPVGWAISVLGLETGRRPPRALVQRLYRAGLREAHPDNGGDEGEAAGRIAALGEARRILLAAS